MSEAWPSGSATMRPRTLRRWQNRVVGVAALVLVPVVLPGSPFAAELRGNGYRLRYDERIWARQSSPPPNELALDCVAAECGPGISVTLIREDRSIRRPGAGAFTPGATDAAALALRIQAMTPGGRLIGLTPVEPVEVAGRYALQAAFAVEDRDLRQRMLVVVVLPEGPSTLHWRLTAPSPDDRTAACLRELLAGLSLD